MPAFRHLNGCSQRMTGRGRSAMATAPVLPTSLWCLRSSMPGGTGSTSPLIRRSPGSTRAAWRSKPSRPRILTASPIASRNLLLSAAARRRWQLLLSRLGHQVLQVVEIARPADDVVADDETGSAANVERIGEGFVGAQRPIDF